MRNTYFYGLNVYKYTRIINTGNVSNWCGRRELTKAFDRILKQSIQTKQTPTKSDKTGFKLKKIHIRAMYVHIWIWMSFRLHIHCLLGESFFVVSLSPSSSAAASSAYGFCLRSVFDFIYSFICCNSKREYVITPFHFMFVI